MRIKHYAYMCGLYRKYIYSQSTFNNSKQAYLHQYIAIKQIYNY